MEKKEILKNKKPNDWTEEAAEELELEHHAGVSVDNCGDSKPACKSGKLRKGEIVEKRKFLVNKEKAEGGARETRLVIPSLVNDTGKLMADPAIQKPIRSDSDDPQNTESRPAVSPPLPKLRIRTKPLDQIPFSRVVAAQKKIKGQFSPYISFPDLLSSLTKSQRSVR